MPLLFHVNRNAAENLHRSVKATNGYFFEKYVDIVYMDFRPTRYTHNISMLFVGTSVAILYFTIAVQDNPELNFGC